MAYKNNNRSSNNYNGNNNYNRNNSGGNFRGNQSQQQYKITSGCQRTEKDGKCYLSAWKKNRFSFLSILVAKSKKSELTKGKNDKKVWTSVSVIVTDKNTGMKQFHWGICDEAFLTCKVNGLGWVISAKKGGFVKTRNLG